MITIGDKIRDLRKDKNISQEELAFELDVSRQTIHKWENDTTQPNADKLKLLCSYFNVSPNYFLSDNENDCKDELAIAETSQRSKKYIIICAVITAITLIAFLTSFAFTIGIGFIVFSDNFGHVMVSMIVLDNYVFYLFLTLSFILFAINILMIFYLKRK